MQSCSGQPPKFQVNIKIQLNATRVSRHLSVSYDYDKIHKRSLILILNEYKSSFDSLLSTLNEKRFINAA